MPLLYIMPTWYCASASPLLANATIALKLAASFALAGIEKIKRHEKAKTINFMSVPQLGSNNPEHPNLPYFIGGPERSRTSDLRFRKPLLYPAELRDHPFEL